MFGCIYDDIESAGNVLTSFTAMLTYCCGVYVNLKTAPWYIKFLGFISPFRYSCELLMRILLAGLSYKDSICDNYDWTYKEKGVFISIFFVVLFFLMSWAGIILKAREL